MSDALETVPAERAQQLLRDVFGFRSYRPNQEEIVAAICAREDAFVVMPTGGGKSLCYQLPALLMEGTCLVISPLISLMKDQVDAAMATGLRAAFLNSSLSARSRGEVREQLLAGTLDLLYVSPERFAMPEFVEALRQVTLSFVAIDEAHCVSEWGHDFRPDYLGLAAIVDDFPEIPVAAFTATATERVQHDIVKRLKLRAPHMVRASFNRPNLLYKVVPKERPADQILSFVRGRAGEPGIIYRTTRKSVEQTAAHLAKHGIRALPYHAGLDDTTRARNQEAFNRDEVDVVVATIAFGMGIDKSNVRYVLHADLPKNVEGYYQETGRAGRDGEPAECLLLFGYGDIPKIRFFIKQTESPDEKAQQERCLNDMVHYATVHACRRQQLLNYFGEDWPPVQTKTTGEDVSINSDSDPNTEPRSLNTGRDAPTCCDVCAGEVASIDATRDAQIVMSAIGRTGQRYGASHIVDVVTGAKTERMRQTGHDQIKTYGAGSDRDKRHWRLLIDNLLAQGLVEQTEGDYPTLALAPKARTVLFEGQTVHMLRVPAPRPAGRARKRRAGAVIDFNETLFEELRALRRRIAAKQGVPPYVVFNDRTLHEMARFFPQTEPDLLEISGVGEARLAKYGQAFMEVIQRFKEAHPETKADGRYGT